MKRIYFAYVFISFLFIGISCLSLSCNSVEPPPDGDGVDTTSHSFTFQSWTFGEHSGSALYDVAIINDTSIWAVGEIYTNDSLGLPDPKAYNVAYWNGSSWTLHRIMFYTICGQQSTTPYPAKSIFAFNENDIWIAMLGGQIAKIENGIQSETICLPWSFTINKIWGTSSNDLYITGNNGNIAHYQNGSWSSIASGTSLNINDIWGIGEKGGNKIILCSAYNFASGGEKKLISISGSTVGEIPWVENRELYTVWFNTRDKIYAGGEGLFYRTKNEWKEETLPALFKFRVRGNELNDIWTVGGFGFAAHYNGKSWKTYGEVTLASGNYTGLAVKENIVIMTGNEGIQAVITIGSRQ